MKTIIRICDSEGNKRSGFELAENKNIVKLFPHGVGIGKEFRIGSYGYKVTNVYIDGFFDSPTPRGEHVIDNPDATLGTHVWILCETDDPRIIEGSPDHPEHESILSDLKMM